MKIIYTFKSYSHITGKNYTNTGEIGSEEELAGLIQERLGRDIETRDITSVKIVKVEI
jgi:hypothetical protein